jgi:hypothetical protein
MTLPFLPNELFIAIAEQTSELGTLLSLMLSNKALSTLLAPVLLLKAAESSAVSKGKTALEHAVSRGDLKLAEAMLSASTLRINERDINRWTLLDIAIRNRHIGLIQLLLAHGADVAMQSPRYCSSPMVLAVLTGQHDVIRMLVAKGADVWALHKVKGFELEFTVLHYAVFRRDLGTVRLLLEGADIGEGTQAIMEALHCCELVWYQNAGWNEIAEVLRPLIPPGSVGLPFHGYWEEFASLEYYFEKLEKDFLLVVKDGQEEA